MASWSRFKQDFLDDMRTYCPDGLPKLEDLRAAIRLYWRGYCSGLSDATGEWCQVEPVFRDHPDQIHDRDWWPDDSWKWWAPYVTNDGD